MSADNSRKSVRWSAVNDAPKLVYYMLNVELRGAAALKEPMTYAGLGIEAGIGASKLGLEL